MSDITITFGILGLVVLLFVSNRLRVVFSTAIVTQLALSAYAETLIGLTPDEIALRIEPLKELLFALGLPAFLALLELLDPVAREANLEATLAGSRVALVVPGVLAIVTGIVAFIALGRRGPMRTVWEHMDEREMASEAVVPS